MGQNREGDVPWPWARGGAEQVDDGQLRGGLGGVRRRRGLHFEGLLGLRETLKKKQPHLEVRWGLWCERDLVGGV